MYFRCVACNRSIQPKKKKPVTTFSGQMNSVYTDKINDFPKDEWEDLCPSCIRSINKYNYTQSEEDSTSVFQDFDKPDESKVDFDDYRLNSQFEYVTSMYEGVKYSSE